MTDTKITADYVISSIDDAEGVALDVREMIVECLEDGTETGVEMYYRPFVGEDGFLTGLGNSYAYFPNMGRGAIWCNGEACWADASSLDDLVAATDDPDRWSA